MCYPSLFIEVETSLPKEVLGKVMVQTHNAWNSCSRGDNLSFCENEMGLEKE